MVGITGNFTSRAPLAPEVLASISTAFADGWADPRKLTQSSHRAALLKKESLDLIADAISLPPSSLHICGEPALLPFLAIVGYLDKESIYAYSSIDQGKVRAIAKSHQGPQRELRVDEHGKIQLPNEHIPGTLVVQSVNGETGFRQDLSPFMNAADHIIIDASKDIPQSNFASIADAIFLDSSSWGGPQGLGFLAIKNSQKYRYPLPHIADIKVPGSYSLPLLIGAATALVHYRNQKVDRASLRSYAVKGLSMISGVEVVQTSAETSPHYLSFLLADRSSEEALQELNRHGIDCDAGSACNPQDLQPSHVIAALGLPTHGHIRMTLHDGVTESDIDQFCAVLKETLSR